jgi:hypothetical protein
MGEVASPHNDPTKDELRNCRYGIKPQLGTGDGGLALDKRSGGFDKGRWPVCCLSDRAGFWPARISPIWAIAGFPCQIRREPGPQPRLRVQFLGPGLVERLPGFRRGR